MCGAEMTQRYGKAAIFRLKAGVFRPGMPVAYKVSVFKISRYFRKVEIMKLIKKTMLATFVSAMCFAQGASAEVCVKVDEARDSLTPAERTAAVSLLENAFRKAGETIGGPDCADAYTVSNIRLGQSITSTVSGSKGTKSLQVSKIEELGAAFDQMANSLVTGATLGDTAGSTMTRDNVTARQAIPNRVENDSLVYANVGPGYIMGVDADEVPITIGGGYRFELDAFALDLGGQMVFATGEDSGGASLLANVGGVYFLDPIANSSSFIGGSLGLSTIGTSEGDKMYSGGGLHARVVAGYEFFRASTMRLIVQADVTLPFYDLESDEEDINGNAVESDTKYAPVFGLSVGGGFSEKRRSITVRHL